MVLPLCLDDSLLFLTIITMTMTMTAIITTPTSPPTTPPAIVYVADKQSKHAERIIILYSSVHYNYMLNKLCLCVKEVSVYLVSPIAKCTYLQ